MESHRSSSLDQAATAGMTSRSAAKQMIDRIDEDIRALRASYRSTSNDFDLKGSSHLRNTVEY